MKKTIFYSGIFLLISFFCFADLNGDFIQAVKDGDTARVLELVDKGADIDTADQYGWTPLLTAASNGNSEIIRLLIDAGADINVCNDSEVTALMIASYYGYTDIAEMFLNAGANVNVVNDSGKTALQWAVEKGHDEIAALLERAVDSLGYSLIEAARNGDAARVDELLAKGADPNIALKGATPLYWAARYGYPEIVKSLLDAGADSTITDAAGQTPLQRAEREGHAETAGILRSFEIILGCTSGDFSGLPRYLAAGNDPGIRDQQGYTPLLYAAMYADPEAVELLLKAGADVNFRGSGSVTPLMTASYGAYGGNPIETMQVLIENGADVNAVDDMNGMPVIVWSIYSGDDEAFDRLRLLLDAGADVDLPMQGITLLYLFIEDGSAEGVDLLLEYGADVNFTAENEYYGMITPITFAEQLGFDDIAAKLKAVSERQR